MPFSPSSCSSAFGTAAGLVFAALIGTLILIAATADHDRGPPAH
jgi:hypothetical protein